MPGSKIHRGVLDGAEEVSVAREPPAQRGTDLRQARNLVPAAEQDLVGSQRACRQYHPPSPRLGDHALVIPVGNRVTALDRADVGDHSPGAHLGPQPLGPGEIGEVRAVLGAVLATERALSHQPARPPAVLVAGRELPGHCLIGVHDWATNKAGGVAEPVAFAHPDVGWQRPHGQDLGDFVVVGVQRMAVDGLGPSGVCEDHRVGPDVDVGIDKRAASHSTGRDDRERGEEAQVVQARGRGVMRGTPEEPVDGGDVTGKLPRPVAPAALQHEHRLARLGQP